MPTLADLNRQKRDYAASGMAQEGDIPYLYELYANGAPPPPPGIGGDAGGMAEGSAAPNPTGTGGGFGGASGAADVGLAGPGITGLGPEVDSLYRDYMASREAGQAGEPGPGGYTGSPVQNIDDFNAFGGYSTLGSLAGTFLGVPGLGLLGSVVDTYNDYSRTKDFNPNAPTDFGSFLESLISDISGGLVGDTQFDTELGRYADETGTGLNRNSLAASTAGTSYSGPKGVSGGAGINDVTGVDFGTFGPSQPSDTSWAGGLDDRGGGAGEGSGGAGAGGGGGGGGGAQNANDILHEGGYISEDEVPGQLRGDVSKTLQEGEGVLTADAVSILGPGFVHGVNMMAKMMRGGV